MRNEVYQDLLCYITHEHCVFLCRNGKLGRGNQGWIVTSYLTGNLSEQFLKILSADLYRTLVTTKYHSLLLLVIVTYSFFEVRMKDQIEERSSQSTAPASQRSWV